MRHTLISVLLCALMITAITPAVAASYKWVDENGQTVYSQTPPPAGTQGVERVKAAPRAPSNSGTAGTAAQKTKDDAAAFNERQSDKKTQQQDKKKMQEADAQRKEHCDGMRADIETLVNKPIVRRSSEDGSESKVLTAEEREADVKILRERVKKECQ
jgi:hypothetical protein